MGWCHCNWTCHGLAVIMFFIKETQEKSTKSKKLSFHWDVYGAVLLHYELCSVGLAASHCALRVLIEVLYCVPTPLVVVPGHCATTFLQPTLALKLPPFCRGLSAVGFPLSQLQGCVLLHYLVQWCFMAPFPALPPHFPGEYLCHLMQSTPTMLSTPLHFPARLSSLSWTLSWVFALVCLCRGTQPTPPHEHMHSVLASLPMASPSCPTLSLPFPPWLLVFQPASLPGPTPLLSSPLLLCRLRLLWNSRACHPCISLPVLEDRESLRRSLFLFHRQEY